MKKRIALLFALLMIVSTCLGTMTACGKEEAAKENAAQDVKSGEKKYTYEEAKAFLDKGDKASAILALRNCDDAEAAAKRKELYISLYGEEFYI